MLAERMNRVSTSPTMKIAGEAAKLKRQGVDVVDFGAGEPDFPTPQPAKDAAQARDRSELHQIHAACRHRRT